jgi:hypothetical protein
MHYNFIELKFSLTLSFVMLKALSTCIHLDICMIICNILYSHLYYFLTILVHTIITIIKCSYYPLSVNR